MWFEGQAVDPDFSLVGKTQETRDKKQESGQYFVTVNEGSRSPEKGDMPTGWNHQKGASSEEVGLDCTLKNE